MHREITPSERLGHAETPLSLYLLTALLGLFLGADLWPALVDWAGWSGSWLPTWPREVFGYRFALIAAVLGGIGSIPGAMNGGLLMGIIENLVAGYISSTYQGAITFAVLILVLAVKPTGLLGKMQTVKV